MLICIQVLFFNSITKEAATTVSVLKGLWTGLNLRAAEGKVGCLFKQEAQIRKSEHESESAQGNPPDTAALSLSKLLLCAAAKWTTASIFPRLCFKLGSPGGPSVKKQGYCCRMLVRTSAYLSTRQSDICRTGAINNSSTSVYLRVWSSCHAQCRTK